LVKDCQSFTEALKIESKSEKATGKENNTKQNKQTGINKKCRNREKEINEN
jgi:hypothetical protein